MAGRTRHLLIVAEDRDDTNLALVGAASVCAHVRRHVAGWRASVLPCRVGFESSVVFQVLETPVDLVGIWIDPEGTLDCDPILDRFGALWPETPRVLLGPGIATEFDAEGLLTRYPGAGAAVREEAEGAVASLCRALTGQPLETPVPPGVTVRRGEAVDHAPSRHEPLAPGALPSPFEGTGVPRLRPGQWACLEISRGIIPFSPVPLDVVPWPVRPLPISRIRTDLALLPNLSPDRVELVPRPADVNLVHFRWVLRALAEAEQTCPVRVTLVRPPDEGLMKLMKQAGVMDVAFEPDTIGEHGERPRPRPTREDLRTLAGEGFRPVVRLAFGHPADRVDDMEHWFEYYAGMGPVRVEVRNARLFPGHPYRAAAHSVHSERNPFFNTPPQPRRGHADVAIDSRNHIVAHRRVSAADLVELQRRYGRIGALIDAFPLSFHGLSILTGRRKRDLIVQLFDKLPEMGDGKGIGIASWRRFLISVARARLVEIGKYDRFPVLGALIDYEYWKASSGPPYRARKGVSYRVGDLDHCILQLNPGQRVATFSHDVLSLEDGASIESASVHPVHLLQRRHRAGPPTILRLDARWKAFLDQVDGRRTVGEITERLTQPGKRGRLTVTEAREAALRLLEAGTVYVRALEREDGPMTVGRGRRVLPFRPVSRKS